MITISCVFVPLTESKNIITLIKWPLNMKIWPSSRDFTLQTIACWHLLSLSSVNCSENFVSVLHQTFNLTREINYIWLEIISAKDITMRIGINWIVSLFVYWQEVPELERLSKNYKSVKYRIHAGHWDGDCCVLRLWNFVRPVLREFQSPWPE